MPEVTHCKWPSFRNIHRLIKDDEHPGGDEAVMALEKIDGSNLGIEIDPDSTNDESLVALHGRNTLLWFRKFPLTSDEKDPPSTRQYGKVKGDIMVALQPYVAKLVKMAKFYNKGRVIFYGEWCLNRNAINSPEPAWFPFGMKLRNSEFYITMTKQLYQEFLDHDISPPKILFSGGTLEEAIDALFELMLKPDAELEGIFITREDVSGTRCACKWKTGQYEEQPWFVLEDHYHPSVEKLRKVYDTKTQKSDNAKDKKQEKKHGNSLKEEEKKKLEQLMRQVDLAIHSVMSKSLFSVEDINMMEKEKRVVEIKRIIAEVITDITEQYAAVNEKVPNEIRGMVGKTVATKIMKHN